MTTPVVMASVTTSCAFEPTTVVRSSGHTNRRPRTERRASSRQMPSDPNHVPSGVRRLGTRSSGLSAKAALSVDVMSNTGSKVCATASSAA